MYPYTYICIFIIHMYRVYRYVRTNLYSYTMWIFMYRVYRYVLICTHKLCVYTWVSEQRIEFVLICTHRVCSNNFGKKKIFTKHKFQ